MRHTWILLLSYTYPEGLKRALDSLKLTTNESISTKVILNGVNKDDYQFVYDRDDIQEIINIEENVGFFKAYNKAILTIPSSDHFVVLNDDVEILDSRWLTAMYDKMNNAEVPSDQDPHTWNNNVGIVGYKQEARVPNAKGDLENNRTERWIMSCALVNPEATRLAGLLDERYFGWWGDFEFLCRLHSVGYKVTTVDKDYIFHEKQHTFKVTDSFNKDNKWPLWDAMCFYEQCSNRQFEWKEAMTFPIQQILLEAKWFLRNKLTNLKKENDK